jgi:hypothetical protein
MAKSILEYMKPYMNLELYQYEKESEKTEKTEKTGKYEHHNAIFEYQSKVGHATGKAQSPRWFREALAKHFAEIEARKPKKMILSNDPNILG